MHPLEHSLSTLHFADMNDFLIPPPVLEKFQLTELLTFPDSRFDTVLICHHLRAYYDSPFQQFLSQMKYGSLLSIVTVCVGRYTAAQHYLAGLFATHPSFRLENGVQLQIPSGPVTGRV